jgi:hypothetical protein
VRLVAEMARGLWESVRETLPKSSDEAGVFLAGMVWAFVLFWSILLAVTYAHCRTFGGC